MVAERIAAIEWADLCCGPERTQPDRPPCCRRTSPVMQEGNIRCSGRIRGRRADPGFRGREVPFCEVPRCPERDFHRHPAGP